MSWKPAIVDLEIPQGSTFDPVWTLKNPDGTPIDLTGYAARASLREEADSTLAVLSLADGSGITLGDAAGTIALLISAEQSTELVARTYVWDLEVVEPGGNVRRILQGRATVSREVTR